MMSTNEMIEAVRRRLNVTYGLTVLELNRLDTTQLTEMVHEADEHRNRTDFSERIAAEIISALAQLLLDERRQKAPPAAAD